ncbi:MAG: putative photosynthetic complex assembly protein PuhE [Anaerolineae bacterium]
MSLIIPIIFTVFLWWLTTVMITAAYKHSNQIRQLVFIALTGIMMVALVGLYIVRDLTEPVYTYLAVTCGVLVWAWQVAGYYFGFVTGPPLTDAMLHDRLNLADRFRYALRFSLYHELLALAFALLMSAVLWGQPNQWGLWMYLALWGMHTSAKLNVFFGVRNFRVDLLPEKMHNVERFLTRRPHNEFFPFAVILASSLALLFIYRGILPDTEPHRAVGFLIVGTMVGLGVIEHWLLVLPLPAAAWGWGLQMLTEPASPPFERPAAGTTSRTAEASPVPLRRNKRILTYQLAGAPFIVDVWEPAMPSKEPPILLVHGWGGTGSYWHQTAFWLSRTNRVIVPDLPGTGRSQPVNHTQNMFDQVDALVFLVDELIHDQVQVIGHSMGGAMSLLLAEQRPQKVERLVLTSLCLFMNEAQVRAFNASMAVFKVTMGLRRPWMAEIPGMPQLMALQYFYRVPDDHEVLHRGLLDYLQLDSGTAVACATNATDDSIPRAAASTTAPTLLIACRQDRVMPTQNVEFTADVIPNCAVRWIDRCGHLPMVEKPEEYHAILHEFLRLE